MRREAAREAVLGQVCGTEGGGCQRGDVQMRTDVVDADQVHLCY